MPPTPKAAKTRPSPAPSNGQQPTRRTSAPGLIRVEGARVHNLKNVSLTIPRDRFTVITDSGAKPEELDEIRATGAAVEVAEEA